MSDVTSAVAAWTAGLDFDDLPSDVVDAAIDPVVDGVGVMLGGSGAHLGRIVQGLARDDVGDPTAGVAVVGAGFRAPVETAVLTNGAAAHALDFDDTWSPDAGLAQATASHPSCSLVPVVLGLGEQLHASGRDVLVAFVAGLEVHGVLGFPGRTTIRSGFHGSAVFGALGAAAAASSLLDLDAPTTATAFGVAAVHANGLNANRGTMTKPYQVGAAAAGGVRAARLAARGFTASDAILDADDGFRMFVDPDRWDPDAIVRSLGTPFAVVEPGVDLKRHASCFFTHRAIDATLQLVRAHDVAADEVAAVEVVAPVGSIVNRPRPRTGLEAKFSLQFTVTEAVLRRRVATGSFVDDRLDDPAVRSLMERVRVHEDPSLASDYPLVERPVRITLADGRVLDDPVAAGTGRWVDSVTRREVVDKYLDLATPVVGEVAAQDSLHLLLSLTDVADVADIAPLLQTARTELVGEPA